PPPDSEPDSTHGTIRNLPADSWLQRSRTWRKPNPLPARPTALREIRCTPQCARKKCRACPVATPPHRRPPERSSVQDQRGRHRANPKPQRRSRAPSPESPLSLHPDTLGL